MSEFSLVSGDMQAAASAAQSAADRARGSDGSDALSALAAALPGTTTAEVVPELGSAWQTGVGEWADEVAELADSIERLAADAAATDGSAGSRLDGLRGQVGGGG